MIRKPTRQSPASSESIQPTDEALTCDMSAPTTATGRAHRCSSRTVFMVMLAISASLAFACWLPWRSLSSTKHTLVAQTAALARMQEDVERILALRETPRQATERRKPNDELLGQVERAMQNAGVPKDLWQDSIPQPAQREANSPYQRMTTRIYFEGITLRQLTGVAHAVLDADRTLFLSSLRLSADRRGMHSAPETDTWNADVAISYLIYVPAQG